MADDDSVWRRPAPQPGAGPGPGPGRGTGPDPEPDKGTDPDPDPGPGTGTGTGHDNATGDAGKAGANGEDLPPPGRPVHPTTGYAGPPPTVVPPRGWRPPAVVAPHSPRELPYQDYDAIDAAEGRARTRTYGVGLVAGAIILIMLCVVCGRWFF